MLRYYHGTVKAFLPSIMRQGIVNLGQPGIFVTTDEQQAWFWAQMGTVEYYNRYNPGHKTSPIVLEIDSEALEGHKLVIDILRAEEGFDYYVKGLQHIPPRFLKVHEHLPSKYQIPGTKRYISANHRPVRVRSYRRRV